MTRRSGFQVEWQCSECHKTFKSEKQFNEHAQHCEPRDEFYGFPVNEEVAHERFMDAWATRVEMNTPPQYR
jgi:hypothetical protein